MDTQRTLPIVTVITACSLWPGDSGGKARHTCLEVHSLGSAAPSAPALASFWAQLAFPRGQPAKPFLSAHLEGATEATMPTPCPPSCPLKGTEEGAYGREAPQMANGGLSPLMDFTR